MKRITDVDLFTRNRRLAREFYTRKVGLKVRGEMKNVGYLLLGATKTGQDAGISVRQPDPKWGPETYESSLKSVGIVTGIGFRTTNLAKTVEQLSSRGVKVEKSSDTFARFWDPDGNVLFVTQDPKPKARRAGLHSVGFRTVVVRDAEGAGAWFTSLGFRRSKVPGEEGEGDFSVYHTGPGTTAIMPFTPTREMYENPEDYDADMAMIGEDTGIAILVDDARKVEAKLRAQGVTISEPAERQAWGGVRLRIEDPDGNRYMLYHMER